MSGSRLPPRNSLICFGASGVTFGGVTDVRPPEIQVKPAIPANADRVAALIDGTRFGVQSCNKLLDLEAVGMLITGERAAGPVTALRTTGVAVLVARRSDN